MPTRSLWFLTIVLSRTRNCLLDICCPIGEIDNKQEQKRPISTQWHRKQQQWQRPLVVQGSHGRSWGRSKIEEKSGVKIQEEQKQAGLKELTKRRPLEFQSVWFPMCVLAHAKIGRSETGANEIAWISCKGMPASPIPEAKLAGCYQWLKSWAIHSWKTLPTPCTNSQLSSVILGYSSGRAPWNDLYCPLIPLC